MSTVKILTDSCAYITPEEAEALDIHIVPLNITVGDEQLEDGSNEVAERFFAQQEYGPTAPLVTEPTVAQFEKAYAHLHKTTDKILALHVSSKLNDTYKRSIMGAETLRGRCNIEIIDTNSILLGQTILVKRAAEAARQGETMDEIIRLVRGLIPHIYTVLFVDSMDYLEQSSTVGRAQAILGSMMQIKPLLFMEDGEIIPMEKVKTVEKAIDKLAEFVAEFDTMEQTVIVQRSAKPTKESHLLQNRLQQVFPEKTFPIIQYNPLLASFVGPKATGVIVYEGLTNF